MKKYIFLAVVFLIFTLPVYATGENVDIKMYTISHPTEAVAGYEYTLFNKVEFKDFVTYYPFLYDGMEFKPQTFDIALLDNGAIYEVKTVTFYETIPNDPDSLRKEVDFTWTPVSSGAHNLMIVYDYTEKVSEIKEDNNNYSFSIYVFPTRKDRYLKFGKDNTLLLLLVGLYFVFLIYYLIQKKRTLD